LTQADETSEFGLKEDWTSVQTVLEQIIPVYDKTNRYISLGTDLKLRNRGISLLISGFAQRNFSLVDLGAGTGTMTKLLKDVTTENQVQILLVDPLSKMMQVAAARTHENGLLAVYECLPFRGGAIDSAMAGFSLRDARNLSEALRQISRMLKDEGKFLIVDLSKPDSATKGALISAYWQFLAPAIAFLSSGRLGLKFGALARTYQKLPKISEFKRIAAEQGFIVSNAEFSMLGGAGVMLLTKIPR